MNEWVFFYGFLLLSLQSNSTQNFTITKSCPGLVEVKEEERSERPVLVTISTQTDCLPEPNAQIGNRRKNEVAEDISNLFENLSLDDADPWLVSASNNSVRLPLLPMSYIYMKSRNVLSLLNLTRATSL